MSARRDAIRSLLARGGKFRPEAYEFILASLDHTIERVGERRHVSGAELLGGLRALAVDRFGLLAPSVLAEWGVSSARDVGEIVFRLVEAQVLAKDQNDSIEDFRDALDFPTAFADVFRRDLQRLTLS